jgi:hypothetical protein
MDEAESITVSIGIFSGRPNPEIELSNDVAEAVAAMIGEAVGAQPTHPQPRPRLGQYYGFLIKTPPQTARRFTVPPEVTVYEGVIAEPARGTEAGWRDVAGLERFLLEQAVRGDYGDLLERVGVDTSELRGEGD